MNRRGFFGAVPVLPFLGKAWMPPRRLLGLEGWIPAAPTDSAFVDAAMNMMAADQRGRMPYYRGYRSIEG